MIRRNEDYRNLHCDHPNKHAQNNVELRYYPILLEIYMKIVSLLLVLLYFIHILLLSRRTWLRRLELNCQQWLLLHACFAFDKTKTLNPVVSLSASSAPPPLRASCSKVWRGKESDVKVKQNSKPHCYEPYNRNNPVIVIHTLPTHWAGLV